MSIFNLISISEVQHNKLLFENADENLDSGVDMKTGTIDVAVIASIMKQGYNTDSNVQDFDKNNIRIAWR